MPRFLGNLGLPVLHARPLHPFEDCLQEMTWKRGQQPGMSSYLVCLAGQDSVQVLLPVFWGSLCKNLSANSLMIPKCVTYGWDKKMALSWLLSLTTFQLLA